MFGESDPAISKMSSFPIDDIDPAGAIVSEGTFGLDLEGTLTQPGHRPS
jgi:hypothetical protein